MELTVAGTGDASGAPGVGVPIPPALAEPEARRVLRDGEAELLGRMPWSSNATYLCRLSSDDGDMLAIYKPQRGERPLWDFARGTLCRREVAAYEVSEALGWAFVPDTVLREGPAGFGMMQRFVAHDPEQHYFTLFEARPDTFRRLAAFDVVINNADRKSGHCLLDGAGEVRAIDHGVSFHAQWKLRTVIWEFGGDTIDPEVRSALTCLRDRLDGDLGTRLHELLDRFEVDAVGARIEHLLARGALPEVDPGYHSYPWPLV